MTPATPRSRSVWSASASRLSFVPAAVQACRSWTAEATAPASFGASFDRQAPSANSGTRNETTQPRTAQAYDLANRRRRGYRCLVPSQRPGIGFWDGIRSFIGGIGFIVFRPSMWGWALVPVVIATLLFSATGALAVWGGTGLADHALADLGTGAWATAGIWALRVVFWIVGLLLAFLVAITLAQPLAGFALDAIARRQELALGGRAWPDQPFVSSLLRSLRVALAALAFSVPLLALLSVVTLLFPPAAVVTVPLKLAVAGFAIAYDFLDYPLSLRGSGVRARAAFLRAHPAAVLGFGLAASSLLLVPGAGLLVLPFGVAGAARMVVLADRPRSM